MIKATDFLDLCKEREFTFFSGTPCSYLKPLINAVINDPQIDYRGAVNEGDAAAMVCGARLTGRKGVAMFQNSGLGNAVNPLTSLAFVFRFPLILIVTQRGRPGGPPDEPQHELMGAITEDMLSLLKIKWEYFPGRAEELPAAFDRAEKHMAENSLPYAFVLGKGIIEPQELKVEGAENAMGERKIIFQENASKKYYDRYSRTDALKTILKHKKPNDVLIATTGKTGRELYTLEDAPEHFYMVGSMGCASSFALGAALNYPSKRWLVIDGDAAFLMRMGNMASTGSMKPDNYLHILLDNEVNDSTGGQASVSGQISPAAVAAACGYREVHSTDSLKRLDSTLAVADLKQGPFFIHFKIKKGSPKNLGRPKVKPFQVKERLIKHLAKKEKNKV